MAGMTRKENIMPSITVYTTETCPYCHHLKDFLNENNVVFKEINLTRYPDKANELFEKSGQMGVPVSIIDGEEIIVGFDKEKISKKLGLN